MKRIIFIGSGSKGNSTLIEYKENRFILIDCGFSNRYFNHVLEINNLNINQIDYTRVDNLIKEWKEESLNYLIQALNNVCDS